MKDLKNIHLEEIDIPTTIHKKVMMTLNNFSISHILSLGELVNNIFLYVKGIQITMIN